MIALACVLLFSGPLADGAGVPARFDTTRLETLVREMRDHNPELQAALQQMYLMDAKVAQEASLPPPELIYMREGMPDFHFGEAMYSRIELMQMFHFPTLLGKKREIAEIVADHAHHEHMEKVLDLLARLKINYAELWYVQQALELSHQNAALLAQMSALSRARYSVGDAGQQDVLRISVEASKNENQSVILRQRELSMKAMIMGLTNRPKSDTIGTAVLADSISFDAPLDALEAIALEARPMVQHDSLMVVEKEAMLSMAHQEYLPDLSIGLQYMTEPMGSFTGWTVTAGISLPFAPWTLGGASGRVEEAEAGIKRAAASLAATRAMVTASVRDLYYSIQSLRRQVDLYRSSILPQARQSLQAGIIAYQAGKSDYLMLIDSYRMLVDMTMEWLMRRMELSQNIARLEREIGLSDVTHIR